MGLRRSNDVISKEDLKKWSDLASDQAVIIQETDEDAAQPWWEMSVFLQDMSGWKVHLDLDGDQTT